MLGAWTPGVFFWFWEGGEGWGSGLIVASRRDFPKVRALDDLSSKSSKS